MYRVAGLLPGVSWQGSSFGVASLLGVFSRVPHCIVTDPLVLQCRCRYDMVFFIVIVFFFFERWDGAVMNGRDDTLFSPYLFKYLSICLFKWLLFNLSAGEVA